MALITTLGLALESGCASDPARYRGLSPRLADAPERDMVAAINQTRSTQRPPLRALEVDPLLNAVAHKHTEIMRAEIARMGLAAGTRHYGDIGARLTAAGYPWRFAAENVAAGENATVDDLFRGLLDSPGHFRNIIAPDAIQVGVAIVRAGNGLFITQVFAAPRAAARFTPPGPRPRPSSPPSSERPSSLDDPAIP